MKKGWSVYWVILCLLLILGIWTIAEGKTRFDERTHAQRYSRPGQLSREEIWILG